MSKVVILKIDTLSHVFTTLESGSKCQFQYELINNDKISNVIQPLVVNDAVLCVFDDVIKIALRVVGKTFNKVTLTKEIELNEGFQITDENILRVLNDTQIYECNVDFKQNLYESLTGNFKSTLRQLFEIDVTEEKEINNGNVHTKQQSAMNFTPSQIIYYGVPGCGKSYEVNKDINEKLDKYGVTDREYHKVRCVFHPEYCNADFVGQIYPCVLPDNKGVEYKFKPGPFSEIVRRAYLNPDEPFFLIIEEINRGNAAAIFGEMFQLLDRIKKGEPADESTENKYDSGWSSYGVDNQDINADIRDIQKLKNEQTNEKNKHSVEAKGSGTDTNPKCYSCIDVLANDGSVLHFSTNTAIRLPPNLSIYATMNTSDQNVFTMDNAFQRRFKFKMIENELNDAAQYDIIIGKDEESEVSTGVRWGSFRNWINKKILSQKGILSKSEDKCLGGWFISTDAVEVKDKKVTKYENISKEDFAEKVLKYLWYDVFRRNSATEVFNEPDVTENKDVVSFAKLAKEFKSKDNVGFDAFKKIFKDIEKDKDDLTKTYAESKADT